MNSYIRIYKVHVLNTANSLATEIYSINKSECIFKLHLVKYENNVTLGTVMEREETNVDKSHT